MSGFAVDAKIATALCGFDKARLNELICRGVYMVAPATNKRSKRWFGLNDILSLFVFRQLFEWGVGAKAAGEMTRLISDKIASTPWASAIVIAVRGKAGRVAFTETEFEELEIGSIERGDFHVRVDLENLRAALLDRLAYFPLSYEQRAAAIVAIGDWDSRRTLFAKMQSLRVYCEALLAEVKADSPSRAVQSSLH